METRGQISHLLESDKGRNTALYSRRAALRLPALLRASAGKTTATWA